MRLLLALATVAMATAVPMPADQFAAISIAPLIIPPEVAEAFKRDLEINPAINYIESDAQKFEDASLVHFVDVAEAAPSAVKFVDDPLSDELESPVESFKIIESSDDGQIVLRNMPSGHADADFHVISVRFADSPLEEEIAPVPVRFFDAPVPVAAVYADVSEDVEAIAPTAVKFVEAPVDAESVDSIRIAEVNEDAEIIAPTAVKFVDAPLKEEIAPLEAEVIAPTAVKFVDTPLEEKVAPIEAEVVAPTAVKFVDAPLEEEIAPIEAEAEDSIRIADVIAPTAVKFVDAPFEGEVVLSAVKFVDAPLEEAESNDGPEFHNPPFKFQNPLLRKM